MTKIGLPLYSLIAVLLIALVVLTILFLQKSAEKYNVEAELSSTKEMLNATNKTLGRTKAELDEKNKNLALKQAEIANLSLTLQNKTYEIEGLQRRLNESEKELEKTKNMLSKAKEEISQIRYELQGIKAEIDDSIEWFRSNSVLPSTLKIDRFVKQIERSCKKNNILKLACISYLMEDELGFSYKDDPVGDKLYSIDEIISRKGGDCEDYSLFFKATLNRLKGDRLEMEGWESGLEEYVVYEDVDSGRYWYYEMAKGIVFGSMDESNYDVACYFYDMSGVGHCAIMLTNQTIDSSTDLSTANLMGAVLFEPQNGQYLGKIGREFHICQDDEPNCDAQHHSIVFVITDDDIFQFSNGKWSYYHGYYGRLDEISAALDRVDIG